MKNTVLSLLMLGVLAACSLDKDPLSEYSEVILGRTDEDGDRIRFENRGEVLAQYESMYNRFRDRQEHWYLDYLLINEARADNAYAGTTGAEVVPFENNSLNAGNSVISRDWNNYMADMAHATQIIENIDLVPDPGFSQSERAQWKAEAKIFRAMIMLDMARLWGNFPVITKVPEDITSENITEVWPAYFPPQSSQEEAFLQIVEDLKAAIPHAPAAGSDKTRLTKAVARSLLAKAYAEKPIQDYAKVIEYSDAVINDGFSLVEDYSMLFGMNEAVTDIMARNTSESIFETHFYTGSGNWVSWMFGRDLLNWDTQFSWAKWVTPSRDLISAFQAEGDDIRYSESIVYYEAGWSNYYPADNYPFMFKMRSANNSIIRLRLADIMLLKAEALAWTGDLNGAADIVDQIRARVNLSPLPASVRGSQDQMIDAVLHERRLELAFEGQRLFDLIRNNKLQEVMNTINQRDSGRLPQVRPFDENSELLPIPQTVLDANSNLIQNPGY
ncbi:RagB/SusD family nutrient uptake outer membrane protein [Natronoflexus pectinivorans]|uniref:Putative outer membrane starch-binding protein n=1 Tax=Natronoflexus pectinivorans TaxID=682526 RepID=A0A4R2GLX0_9BACT|nr:RagB/SusD family nutrient uptake outer membrane protein [Natronoflexus pectinivorans]TCO09707.1 putative outer membrane starch-binding protein [Natronoflexus pectinivorans]